MGTQETAMRKVDEGEDEHPVRAREAVDFLAGQPVTTTGDDEGPDFSREEAVTAFARILVDLARRKARQVSE